ncbi:hypothetical protein GLAREA_12524 [Glarea lozoyensis ATCC 20868]|uniref:Ergosterol biosynthetic protein 28 n=1 Tax=Glarea lozoyensis (strain ATCC 20868 / MF5171) TaxID=1116229 RepID=S3DGQ6_GLAL2|nr:uncharacterized protein GLAREA_12524 [Glarea lozoyensis ATCC 20868]EPE31221.1 hypothetical protein GLAREA_12524 [Glarea lozoyensis ATCC 20868]
MAPLCTYSLSLDFLNYANDVQVSIVSIGNTVQCYLTTNYSEQVYLGPAPTPGQAYPPKSPTTPLSSRTFGTWTLIQSMVRAYAAYNISNPQIYQMAYLTYVVAWLHFMSEWWVFKTARWGRGLMFPVLIANATLVWMWKQHGFYVQ